MKVATRVLAIASLILLGAQSSRSQWSADTLISQGTVYSLAVNGSILFAGTDNGVFLSTDDGTSWTVANSGLASGPVYALTLNGTSLFAAINGGGVYRSNDSGSTWTAVNNGITDSWDFSLGISGTNILAGCENGQIFLSTDNGDDWNSVTTGLISSNITAFVQSGTNLFASSYGEGVILSTDNGATWTPATTGLFASANCLAVSGPNLFAGTDSGVFISSNNGSNWQPVDSGLTVTFTNSLAVNGTNLFAGIYFGVFESTDNGSGWSDSSAGLPTKPIVNALAVKGSSLFAAADSGVFRLQLPVILPVELASFTGSCTGSTIELQWKTATELNNSGFEVEKKVSGKWQMLGFVKGAGTSNAAHSYSFADKNISSGTVSYRLMQTDHNGKTQYSQTITVNANVVKEFALRQNYPNPFNPSTVISFDLPAASQVSLKVYDSIGREVATLINEYRPAGTYQQQFDFSRLASGLYIYRLNSGAHTSVKTMLLLK